MVRIGRPSVCDDAIVSVADRMIDAMYQRINKHGDGAFVGPHEAFGVVHEEYDELGEALRANNEEQFKRECMDIAVAALFAIVSLERLEGPEARDA